MKSPDQFPEQLSGSQRQYGKKLIQRFVALNGVSVAVLMNDLLILYGIRNGLTDPQLALLASFMHLTMPFMILGKIAIRKYGAARTWGFGWFMRYVSASLLVAAPFLRNIGPQWMVAATVLTGGFGFAFFRSIGLVGNSPIIGEITTVRDRGKFISGNFVRSQSTYFATMVAVIFMMRFIGTIWVYQLAIGIGCVLGIYASTRLIKAPESQTPSRSAEKPVGHALRTLWNKKRYRKIFFAWAAAFVAWSVVIPFAVITLKNGYGISDHGALMFTLLLLAGGIISSLINGILSDRVGPRPLLILYVFGFFIIAAWWALAPDILYIFPAGLAFFVAGFCKTGIIITTGHYFLTVTEEKDRVGTSLFSRMFTGAAAGLAGSALGGSILKVLQSSPITGLDIYRTYFRIIIIVLIPFFFLVFNLDKLREWKVRNILSLLLSPRDMRALFIMNRIEQSPDVTTDVDNLVKLGRTGSHLSESTITGFLYSSPRLSVRVHALQALRQIDFKENTINALIEELDRGEYTSAWVAAEILGERGIVEAVPHLRRSLESGDPFLKGKCMVALAQLNDTEYYPRIISLFREEKNPRLVIHGANALVEMDDLSNLSILIEKTEEPELAPPVYDELYTAIATLCGSGETFYRFLRDYNNDKEEGFTFIHPIMEKLFHEEAITMETELVRDTKISKTMVDLLHAPLRENKTPPLETFSHYLENHTPETTSVKMFFCIVIVLCDYRQRGT